MQSTGYIPSAPSAGAVIARRVSGLRCDGVPQTVAQAETEDGRTTTRHYMSSEFGGPLGVGGPHGPPPPVGPTEMVAAAAAAIAAAPNAPGGDPLTHHTMTAVKTEVPDSGNMTTVTADVGPSQIMDNVTGTFSFTQCKL